MIFNKKINNNIIISILEIESSNTLPEDCYSVKSAQKEEWMHILCKR